MNTPSPMTHSNCGGQITLETVEVGRCDRCGLAGIVCEAPR